MIASALLGSLPGLAQMPTSVCRSSFRTVEPPGPLFVRSYPSPAAEVTTSVPSGSEVLVNGSDRTGGWAEITLPGDTRGWAEARRLAPSPVSSRQFNGLMEIKTLDGGPVNLRNSPSLIAAVITQLDPGTVVTLVSNEGQWSQVTTATGDSGYIANLFLICTEARTMIPAQ
jgi:N-acetylmuramoyl-L-alanine amidase